MQNPDINLLCKNQLPQCRNSFWHNQTDRLFHMYLVGQTGVGKSTMIRTMIQQDIVQGRGLCLIEPHGDLVRGIYEAIPKDKRDQVIYLDTTDPSLSYGYNPLRMVSKDKRALVASPVS